MLVKRWLVLVLCVGFLQAGSVLAAEDTVQGVRIIPMHNPKQPFDMAAKIQWNPHHKRWDKVLVVYNGAPTPPQDHPAWTYLNNLQDPKRPPRKPGENIGYKPFHINAYCTDETPLSSGKPLHIHFNNNKPGMYTEKDYFRDWNCPKWQMGLKNARIVNGKESRDGKQSLRLHLEKYQSGCRSERGCFNWKPDLGKSLDSIYYSYWVKFPKGFDFVLGGKLPGVGSADGGTGGGIPNGKNGWSVRVMWERHGQLGQYVYHMDQPKHFGEFFKWDVPPVETGKWYQIKTFVRLNTPGQRNGMVRTWLNGREVLNRHGLRFRNLADMKIERFLFSTFFGGSGPRWAPTRDQIIYLDDFVISPSKI